MKQNDSRRLTAAACSAAVHLLDDDDRVALWEFDANARPLHSGWLRAGDWDAWQTAVKLISQRGEFTDFRAAFAGAVQHFSRHPAPGRRVVVLLTDGVFEPNLAWEGYAPHSFEYILKSLTAKAAAKLEFQPRTLPVARRLARAEIDHLQRLNVEIFTIALGPKTETELLNEAARLTSRAPTEVRSFSAAEASDLISVFAAVLRYLGPREVLGQAGGQARPGESLALAADPWMVAPRLLVAADQRLDGTLIQEGRPVVAHAPGHESIFLAALRSTQPFEFRFAADAGRYQALLAAQSLYRLRIEGLRAEYRFGEPVSGRVLEENSGPAATQRVISLNLTHASGDGPTPTALTGDLAFSLQPPSPGVYQLFAQTRIAVPGGDAVERRSLAHKIEILPAFSVRPGRVDFGQLKPGTAAEGEIVFHSGLNSSVTVRVESAGRYPEGRAAPEPISFRMTPGEQTTKTLHLRVPERAAAGDWEGIVIVVAGDERTEIPWTAHLPSLWERVRWWLMPAILLLSSLLAYLVFLWGLRPGPYGTLLPHGDCPGVIRRPIRLGSVTRGLFRRWFNWRRNEVEFLALGIPRLPRDLEGALVFYRWGTVMLSNRGRPSVQSALIVRDSPAGRDMIIPPGRSVRLRHGAMIRFAECEYRFDNPR